jgi:hypothetical protein
MGEAARDVLLLLAAAAVLTLAAFPVLWLLAPERRVRRALGRAVGAKLDAEVVTAEAGAGYSTESDAIAVAWDRGRWRLSYRSDEILGAEIIIDGAIAARVFRAEPRLPLERVASDAESVSLRLLFEDPRHPDFEIALWPAAAGGRPPATAGDAIRQANTWLARTEALLRRRPIAAPVIRAEASEPRPPIRGFEETDDGQD